MALFEYFVKRCYGIKQIMTKCRPSKNGSESPARRAGYSFSRGLLVLTLFAVTELCPQPIN